MVVYIDSQYRCHVENTGSLRAVESGFFDDKCKELVEGYCLIPENEYLRRQDGTVLRGPVVFPFVNSQQLLVYQKEYELENAYEQLRRLGVSV